MLRALEALSREFGNRLEALSAASAESARKQLKTQEKMYLLKIETLRTASAVQVEHRAAELEAQQADEVKPRPRQCQKREGDQRRQWKNSF